MYTGEGSGIIFPIVPPPDGGNIVAGQLTASQASCLGDGAMGDDAMLPTHRVIGVMYCPWQIRKEARGAPEHF